MKTKIVGALLFAVATVAALPAGASVMVVDGDAIGAPDFTVTFENGFADPNLNFSWQQSNILSMPGSVGFLDGVFVDQQGLSKPYAYFSGDTQSGHTYLPEVISVANAQTLSALSFYLGTGYNYTQGVNAYWEGYLAGQLVGSGSFTRAPGKITFVSDAGFDQLKIGTYYTSFNSFQGNFDNGNAIAFSDVVGQYYRPSSSDVPEPATLSLFSLGLLGVAGIRRRRQKDGQH